MDNELLDLLSNYAIPPEGVEVLKHARIAFIVGVSGAGKNTVIQELLKTNKYKLIISHTTRQPRKNLGVMEQDGKEYHFIDQQEAKRMLETGAFIEAKVYSGNIYGTSLEEVKSAYNKGKIAIADIEVQGVSEYMKIARNVVPIFILPPNFNTWRQRLKDRYVSANYDFTEIQRRLDIAKKELEEALSKDYFEFVVNDDLTRAVHMIDGIAHGHITNKKHQEARQTAQDILARLNV